jgi:hypothetical protein
MADQARGLNDSMQRYKVEGSVGGAARQAAAPAAPAQRAVRATPAVDRRSAGRPWVARKSATARTSSTASASVADAAIGSGDAVWKEF